METLRFAVKGAETRRPATMMPIDRVFLAAATSPAARALAILHDHTDDAAALASLPAGCCPTLDVLYRDTHDLRWHRLLTPPHPRRAGHPDWSGAQIQRRDRLGRGDSRVRSRCVTYLCTLQAEQRRSCRVVRAYLRIREKAGEDPIFWKSDSGHARSRAWKIGERGECTLR